MSYATITQCTRDPAFRDRVTAGALKEAIASVVYSETLFAEQLRNTPDMAIHQFIWPLSIDNEAAYEYALNADPPNPNPGGDVGVITDASIQAGIQTHWPQSETAEPTGREV